MDVLELGFNVHVDEKHRKYNILHYRANNTEHTHCYKIRTIDRIYTISRYTKENWYDVDY